MKKIYLVLILTAALFNVAIGQNVNHIDFREAGDLDPDFGNDGKVIFNLNGCRLEPQNMVRQPDGKIVVVAYIGNRDEENCIATGQDRDIALVRFNADGTVDNSFGFLGMWIYDIEKDIENSIGGVAVQPDGKILVGVYSKNLNEDVVIRFNADGSYYPPLLQLLSPAGGGPSYIAKHIVVQPDGKIVVGGHQRGLWDHPGNYPVPSGPGCDTFVTRYNSNGSLDYPFGDSGGGIDYVCAPAGRFRIDSLIMQPDGKILLAGSSTSFGIMARLNSDGALDATFGAGGIRYLIDFEIDGQRWETLNSAGFQLAVQSDGKIVLGGKIYSENETIATFLARFNPDGEIDNSFSADGIVPISFDQLQLKSLLIQPDNSIIWAGNHEHTLPSQHNDFFVARYTPEGILDRMFADDGTDGIVYTDFSSHPIAKTNDVMSKAMLLPNGKILALGSKGAGDEKDIILARYLGDQAALPFSKTRTTLTSHLSGRNSVPQVETQAQGQSIFHFNQDATELDYKINLSNIQGVTGIAVLDEGGLTDDTGRMNSSLNLNRQTCLQGNNSLRCDGRITNRSVIEQFIDLLEDKRAFLVVTTTRYPTGELRARILEDPDR